MEIASRSSVDRQLENYIKLSAGPRGARARVFLNPLTGVVTPCWLLPRSPECQKYLVEGSHRRLYTFSPGDYQAMRGIWEGEHALPTDPPGELVVVDGLPEGGKIHDLTGEPCAFTPDYAPEEMFEIAERLTKAAMQGAGSL